jgi:hypothetical protein
MHDIRSQQFGVYGLAVELSGVWEMGGKDQMMWGVVALSLAICGTLFIVVNCILAVVAFIRRK